MTEYGPAVGSYSGRPIFDYIIMNGLKLFYNGVLQRTATGEAIPNLLRDGDYLLGTLIYSPERNLRGS